MNEWTARFALLTIAIAASPSFASACPSDVDPTFGEAGTAFVSPSPHAFGGATAVATADDGDILLAGAFGDGTIWHPAVVRLNSDGSADPEFGQGGVAVLEARGGLGAIALDDAGRIVAAGQMSEPPYSLLVVRLDASGELDPEFGQGGTWVGPDEHSRAWDLALLSDGRLVVAGDKLMSGDPPRWIPTLFAFDDDGQPSEGFGNGGATSLSLPFSAIGTTLERIAGDALVFAGYGGPDVNHDVFVAKLDSAGALAGGFGTGGVRTFTGVENEISAVLGSDAAGRVYLASQIRSTRRSKILVRRFLENGLDDPDYSGGSASIRFRRAHSVVDLAVDAAGTATVLVWRRGDAFLRFTPQGARDRTFGKRGVHRMPREGYATGLALQDDGKILLSRNVGRDIAVSRFAGGTWDGQEQCVFGCGDGVVRIGEKCDDGNATNGDGCSAACLLE